MTLLRQSLIVFFKSPVRGQVKTRLAQSIQDEPALSLYQSLLQDNLELARRWARKSVHHNLAPYGTGKRSLWHALGLSLAQHQYGSDLGMRMEQALREELQKSDKAIIIGTDTPQLNLTIIEDAFNQLDSHDAVLGPCDDGGYYLIGLKKIQPGLLLNLPWSSSQTLSYTKNRLENTHYRVSCHLPQLRDIDTIEDLKQLNYRPDLWSHSLE